MLIASYTWNQEDDFNWDWQDFKDKIRHVFKPRTFPLQLIALNSNWRGQTGYATVNSVDELTQKIASFDSSYYELHKIRNSYEFRLSTHDVPCGFTIQIRSIK
jgi:hypothetical protein